MLFVVLLLSLCLAKRENCHILEKQECLMLSRDGNVIIGAVFLTYSGIQTATLPHSGTLNCIRIYGNGALRLLSLKAVKALIHVRCCLHTEEYISQTENDWRTCADTIPHKNGNEDVLGLRYEKYAYDSTVAVLLRCTENQRCEKDKTRQSWQAVKSLKKVNCTTDKEEEEEEVQIHSTKAMTAKYNVMTWQPGLIVEVQHKSVVCYVAFLLSGQRFVFNPKDIVWIGENREKPRSVCSESCPPETGKAAQKERPVCCYDCVPCAEGAIVNQTDSNNCEQCPGEYWSNAERDKCVLKVKEYLFFTDVIGVILTLCSLFGIALSVSVTVLFVVEKDTKASNSELLLFSLTLRLHCTPTFAGRPSQWYCTLRHTAFGITLVFCISVYILGKTIVVLMAFRVTLLGSNINYYKRQVIKICKNKNYYLAGRMLNLAGYTRYQS